MEVPVLWPPDAKSWLTGKDFDAGKDWRQKGMTEDDMVGWHHQLNGHESEQTPGDSEGQGSLVCCSPWGHRVGHDWVTKLISLVGKILSMTLVARQMSAIVWWWGHSLVLPFLGIGMRTDLFQWPLLGLPDWWHNACKTQICGYCDLIKETYKINNHSTHLIQVWGFNEVIYITYPIEPRSSVLCMCV